MAKYELLIQLITEGRPGWQVRQPVDKAMCRKMTDSELSSIGAAAVLMLRELVTPNAPVRTAPAVPEVRNKKR